MQLFTVLTIFYNKTSNNYESRRTALGYVTFFFCAWDPNKNIWSQLESIITPYFFRKGEENLALFIVC